MTYSLSEEMVKSATVPLQVLKQLCSKKCDILEAFESFRTNAGRLRKFYESLESESGPIDGAFHETDWNYRTRHSHFLDRDPVYVAQLRSFILCHVLALDSTHWIIDPSDLKQAYRRVALEKSSILQITFHDPLKVGEAPIVSANFTV